MTTDVDGSDQIKLSKISPISSAYFTKSVCSRTKNPPLAGKENTPVKSRRRPQTRTKRNPKKLIHKLALGNKVDIDLVMEQRIKKNMIFRTYRPDFSQLAVYESDHAKMKRKIEKQNLKAASIR